MAATQYTAGRTLLLPEYTPGLIQSGEGITWTTESDPHTGPVGRLRDSYAARPGYTVRELPAGTGWEATDATGRVTVQVLAAPARGSSLNLPPSFDALAGQDAQAQSGLAMVRRQNVVPNLAGRLAEATAGRDGSARVMTLLKLAGRIAGPADETPPTTSTGDQVSVSVAHGAAARALESALTDPQAAAGLQRLGRQSATRSRAALLSILVAVSEGRMTAVLRILADDALSSQTPEFYQAFARNQAAQTLAEQFGGALLLRIVQLQPGPNPAVRMARAGADIDRVLRGLTDPNRTDAERADLVARTRNRSTTRSIGGLDRLYGLRPRPSVQIAPVTADPNWSVYAAKAATYADDHPVSPALTADEMQLRGALHQIIGRARAGEYDPLSPLEKLSLIQDFDSVAAAVRLDQGWINASRAQLQEAIGSPGSRSVITRWLNRVPRRDNPRGATIPDGAFPPVRPNETGDALLRPREWVEQKSHQSIGSGPTDAAGVFRSGRAAASQHLRDARADLDQNLPLGSTLAMDYARDPQNPTRNVMLTILFAEPRIVRVRFGGTTWVRDGAGGFRIGTWPG